MIKPGAPIQVADDEVMRLETELYDNISIARADWATQLTRIQEGREYLEAEKTRYDVPYKGACEFVAPFVKETLFALLSEIAPAVLDPKPFLRFDAAAVGDNLAAYIEPWMQALLFERVRARDILRCWFYAGLRDGVAPLFVNWETTVRTLPAWEVTTDVTVDPITGQVYSAKQKRRRVRVPKTVYDYPMLSLIPIEDFLVYPAIDADIQRSEGVGARFNVSGDYLTQGLLAGDFDREAVDKVLAASEDALESRSPEDTLHDVGENPNIHPDPRRNMITLFEGAWRLPGRDIEEPGCDYWVTYHEATQTLLRILPLEEVFWHGRRPFELCRPYANIRGVFADSVVTSGAGFVQDAKTTLIRLAVDATALGVAPPMLVSASMYKKVSDTLEDNRKPFGVIPFPDMYFNNGGKGMSPFSPGIDPRSIIAISELLDTEGQKGTTATDTLKSMPTPNQITATQASQIFESSKKLIGLLVEHCAQACSEVGQQVWELCKQYADHESLQTLWARVNSESGVPWEAVAQGDYTVVASGVSETGNKQVLFERAMMRDQILANEPFAQDADLRYKRKRDLLETGGTRNPEDYLGTMEQWQQKEQEQKQMALAQTMLAVGAAGEADAQAGMQAGAQAPPMEGMPQGME